MNQAGPEPGRNIPVKTVPNLRDLGGCTADDDLFRFENFEVQSVPGSDSISSIR